jgi:hypothetical protein
MAKGETIWSMADTPDFQYVPIGSTIAKVRADANGANGAAIAAMVRPRGGLTNKLHCPAPQESRHRLNGLRRSRISIIGLR